MDREGNTMNGALLKTLLGVEDFNAVTKDDALCLTDPKWGRLNRSQVIIEGEGNTT